MCLALSVGQLAVGQTVIINEVSNGPAGAQEYFELLVVPDGPVTPCTPQACLDLRGWMFDDNSGYHGAGGVATGAARFSANALWSCVPVGTLIVIYNAEDVNPSLPSVDASLGDGNCSIVLPSSDLSYFEYTNTTPAPVLCDYPGGWGSDPAPNWSNLALANTGDCVHIADASGCMVFSLCFGNVSQNASVHFPGNGGDRVWSFGSGDPFSTGTWIQGCAGDIAACGADDQTPGTANNAANAAWMDTFNNGCVPPQQQDPLEASATSTAACNCNGTASAEASGSTAPYDFVWYALEWTALGQTTDEATDLCGGTYHVIVTSAAGCIDTATVEVLEDLPADAGGDASIDLCSNDDPVDLFDLLTGSPQSGGTWSPALPGTSVFDPASDTPDEYTYTVSGNGVCPADEAVVQVDVGMVPDLTLNVTDVTCFGLSDGTIDVVVDPPGAYTYDWSGGLSDAPSHSGLSADTWSVEVSSGPGCSSTATATINEPDELLLASSSTPALCGATDGSACVDVDGGAVPYTIQWNDPEAQTDACATDIAAGPYTATVTDAQGCTSDATVTVASTGGDFTVTHTVEDVLCSGGTTGAIALTIDPPGEYAVDWTGPDGYTGSGDAITGLEAGNYNYDVQDPSGCGVSSMALVNEPGPLSFSATGSPASCVDLCDGRIEPIASGGTAPYQLLLGSEQFPLGTIDDRCAGTFTITLQDAADCTLSTEVIIEEGATPDPPVITPAGPFCSSDAAVLLSATPVGGVWSGPGVIDPTSGLFHPTSAGAGTQEITYTLGTECGGSALTEIIVHTTPTARFTPPLEEGDPATDNSANADDRRWWLNDADMGNAPQLILPSSDPGATFFICLAAYTDAGCGDTTCSIVTIPSPLLVHVPNAFSPNGDDINDLFHLALSGPPLKTFDFSIYDRWGKAFFTTTDPNVPWDGNAYGKEVPIGVYAWRIALTTTKEERVLQGHVTLLR